MYEALSILNVVYIHIIICKRYVYLKGNEIPRTPSMASTTDIKSADQTIRACFGVRNADNFKENKPSFRQNSKFILFNSSINAVLNHVKFCYW